MGGEVGGKFMTVGKLKDLLIEIPDDLLITAHTVADTGNLAIFSPGEQRAFVDMLGEEIVWVRREGGG